MGDPMKSAALLFFAGLLLCAPALAADTAASPAALRAIPLRTIDGTPITLNNWAGQVLLVVNVASQCGLTPQYTALQNIHTKYTKQGFSVLAFPSNDFGAQEPGTAQDIKDFCSSQYKVTFPLFEKTHVKGPEQHPLYAALTGKASPVPGEVKWNFGKFLIGKNGAILKRWAPETAPDAAEITAAIESALKAPAPVANVRPITFFGAASAGDNIIFCINTGGAIRTLTGPEGVHAIRKELKTAITAMPPEMKFNVICFNGYGDIFKPESVPATDEAKNEAITFLAGYYGGTAGFSRTRTERYGRAGKDEEGIAYVPLMPEDVKEIESAEGAGRLDLALAAAFHRRATTIYLLQDTVPAPQKKGAGVAINPDDLIFSLQNAWKKIGGENAKVVVHTSSVYTAQPPREISVFLTKLANKFTGKYRAVKPKKLP